MKNISTIINSIAIIILSFSIYFSQKSDALECLENGGKWELSGGTLYPNGTKGDIYSCKKGFQKEERCKESGGKIEYSTVFNAYYCKKECEFGTINLSNYKISTSKYDCSEKL